MRSPTAIATHGTGKSRSKPLHKMHHQGSQPSKKLMAQHRGYTRLMNTYDRVIKRTGKIITVRLNPVRATVRDYINKMKPTLKKSPFKLNINTDNV